MIFAPVFISIDLCSLCEACDLLYAVTTTTLFCLYMMSIAQNPLLISFG